MCVRYKTAVSSFEKCPGGGPQGGLLTGLLFCLQVRKAGSPCKLAPPGHLPVLANTHPRMDRPQEAAPRMETQEETPQGAEDNEEATTSEEDHQPRLEDPADGGSRRNDPSSRE